MVHTQAISAVWRVVNRGENCKGPTEEGIVKLIPGMVYVAIPGTNPSSPLPSSCLHAVTATLRHLAHGVGVGGGVGVG